MSPKTVKKLHEAPQFPEDPPEMTAEIVPMSMMGGDEAESRALAMPQFAAMIQVTDQKSLKAAERFREEVKALLAEINGKYDPRIAQAFALHRGLLKDKRGFTDPLEEAEKIINKQKIAPFLAAEEAKRKEAERLRAEAEAKARQEAEKAVGKSEVLEAEGKFDQAAAVVDKAAVKVDEILSQAPAVPEIETDLALKKDWKFSVINPKAVPAEYLIPDEKKIGRVVRASNGGLKIPGVRIWSEDRVQ
jgi:hypothetical protein